MNKKHLLFGLLLLLFRTASAQSDAQPKAAKYTLQETLIYALSNNESINKAILNEKSAEYKINEIKGSGLPQVSGNGTLTMNPALATQLLPGELVGAPGTTIPVQFGTKYIAQGGVDLQFMLFRKSFFVGLKAANTTKELYSMRTQMTREEIIYNVSSAYLQVLQTKQQFNIIDANFSRLQQLEKMLTLQYKNDVATKVQLNRVIVNKINLENQRTTLSNALKQQKNALKFFMGMPLEQEIELADAVDVLNTSIPTNENAAEIIASRLEFKLLSTQKELNELNAKNIRAGYYPTLNGFGSYAYNAQRNEFNFFDNRKPWFEAANIGLRLNIPIFDGFQKRNQIRQARVEIEKLDQDLSLLTRQTQMSLDNAITQMKTSLASIQAQERNVTLAQEVYSNTNELYQEGLAPLTDVLETEVNLREAQTNLTNEKLKYQLAQLTYLQAKGELNTLTK